MLEYLLDTDRWNRFLLQRTDNEFVNEKEQKELVDFISNARYLPICKEIVEGTYTFSIPKKKKIAKNSSGKKRVVYFYNHEEMIILKYLAFLLYDYDHIFAPNLYSFRRGKGVKTAITNLLGIVNIRKMYGIKIDISNYFNSINPDTLLLTLKNDVDEDVFSLMYRLLIQKKVMWENKVITEDTGAMAGVPFSPFLANYYLKDLDRYFIDKPVVYMRYADVIILFSKTKEELEMYYYNLLDFVRSKGLDINESKLKSIEPGEDFEFLGFIFGEGVIDVSQHSVEKMKAKIRRKARALRRWRMRKGLPSEKSLVAINKRFNSKFYGKDSKEMSWMYWYFPFINTSASLEKIDHYMQQMQRWIFTGRHSKVNFKACPYELMKQCGYRPLVTEYYKFKGENEKT